MTAQETYADLAANVRDLRRRMLVLSRILPIPYLRFLDADLNELDANVHEATLLRGLSNSVEFVRSDVESALREVWDRTAAE